MTPVPDFREGSVIGSQRQQLAAVNGTPAHGLTTVIVPRERIEHYQQAATAPNTVRAYRHDWNEFETWCRERAYSPLPAAPDVIAAYAAELADRPVISVATIERRLAAIGRMHREAGIDPPPNRALAVQKTMTGIRRELGTAPRQQREALWPDELVRLLDTAPADTLAGLRDRALLLFGYYHSGRRSQLVALDVTHVVETTDGLRVTEDRSKTDQEAAGRLLGIPRKADPAVCPVRALGAWLDAAGIADGPLWRAVDRWDNVAPERMTDRAVALIVKRACSRAGIDPARYAGHSLRSGFATAAGQAKAPERLIMRQTGHASERMVRRYIRTGDVLTDNAGHYVNLSRES